MPLMSAWLDAGRDAIAESAREWTAADWRVARRLITIHGLAPHLAGSIAPADLASLLPAKVHSWVVEQDRLNTRRVELLHTELRAILRAAAQLSIDVMPLKGALLTTAVDGAYRRPMADLDLLVRPADTARLEELLHSLGYERRAEPSPRPTHDVYARPGGDEVVSIDEHPDNPRRVEVHTEVVRHLWGWIDQDELTALLWARARLGEVLGERAWIPQPDDLLAHVAIHASSDLLVGRGRLVQWIDLAIVGRRIFDYASLPHPSLVYPAVRLAARVMPGTFAEPALAGLEAVVPRSLARWAAAVPLDDRCGLMAVAPGEPSSPRERWRRWSPARWRLAVAYGEAPLPVALVRHARMLARVWRRRVNSREELAGRA